MALPLTPRLLLPTLAALFVTLTLGARPAHAAGGSRVSSALQISVEVIRPCIVDAAARAPGTFDIAARESMARATESALVTSCGVSETRVRVLDVRVNLVGSQATLPRLDVEF